MARRDRHSRRACRALQFLLSISWRYDICHAAQASLAAAPIVEGAVERRAIRSALAGRIAGASETLIAMGTQGPFRVSVRSSAAVDRGGAGVTPHSSACLEFAPNAGLWTTILFADDAARDIWRDRVAGALRWLSDSGFGGERSRGWGHAEIEFSESAIPLPRRGANGETGWWLLSLFYPSAEDSIDWSRGNYSVVARGGRVESTAGWGLPKRATRMIAEGSVLASSLEPRGAAPDVAPEGFPHPVYRWGRALALPVPLKPEPSRMSG
jgi:CRISPR type III-A-associated RAMP protein Csm4